MKLNIYIHKNYIMIISRDAEVDKHKHHGVQLCFDLDKKKCIITQSDTEHSLKAASKQVIILVDPLSEHGELLKSKYLGDANDHAIIDIDKEFMLEFMKYIDLTFEGEDKSDLIYEFVIDRLISPEKNLRKVDTRVIEAKKYISTLKVKRIGLEEISSKVYLSSSRFAHLFKLHEGIPLRRYLLWLRIHDAVKLISEGKSFTEAAHGSGFSDAAHLTRTFNEMFGLNLRKVFRDSKFIQVILK